MGKLFNIKSKINNYEVVKISSSVEKMVLNNKYSLCLIDDFYRNQIKKINKNKIIFIKANENSKQLTKIVSILTKMANKKLSRSDKILVVGGGVLQDIGTLVTSLYRRGINWDYIPTTVLAMIDSCIGGKSSINLGKYKNQIGNYWPPKKILLNAKFAETQKKNEFFSGLSEGFKITYVSGKNDSNKFFENCQLFYKTSNFKYLQSLLEISLYSKKRIIESDEFDDGKRLFLNFGHSFGHSIESITKYSISHGFAVAIGCVMEIIFTANYYKIKMDSYTKRLINSLLFLSNKMTRHQKQLLKKISVRQLFEILSYDKKMYNGLLKLPVASTAGRFTLKKIDFKKDKAKKNFFVSYQELLTLIR